jgi:hypothetical protein
MSGFTKALLSKHAVVTTPSLLRHDVGDSPRSNDAATPAGLRPLRRPCPDKGAVALQALEDALGVHGKEPRHPEPTIGHDNALTPAGTFVGRTT